MTAATATEPARSGDFGPIHWVIYYVVCGTYLYHLAYNFMPDAVRHLWYGTLFVGHLFLMVQTLLTRPNWSNTVIFFCAITMCTLWLTATALGFSHMDLRQGDTQSIIKNLLIFIPLVWIFSHAEKLPLNAIKYLTILSILFATLLAITQPTVISSGLVRWYYVTGLTTRTSLTDSTGPHSAAYFMMFCVIIIDQFRKHAMLRWEIALPLMLMGMAMIWGYQVRTIYVMMGVYIAVSIYLSWRRPALYRTLFWIAFVFIALGVIYYVNTTGEDLMRLGSGRVGNWSDRIDRLSLRPLEQLLIGHGLETDFYVSQVWRDEPKDAHNDVLHFMLEGGFIGLVTMILYLVAINNRLLPAAKASLWAAIASACISNGIMTREAIALYWFLSLAIANGVLEQYGRMVPAPDYQPAPTPLPASRPPLMGPEPAPGMTRAGL